MGENVSNAWLHVPEKPASSVEVSTALIHAPVKPSSIEEVSNVWLHVLVNYVPPPPPPPVVVPTMLGGGAAVAGQGCGLNNEFDWCLWNEYLRWREMLRHGLEGVCGPNVECGSKAWWDEPRNGRTFREFGQYPLPPDDGLDHDLLSITVPVGYDGILLTMVNMFMGAGFVEVSGDITWRIKINNQYYMKDLGIINFTRSKPKRPYKPGGGGYRLQSGQVLTYQVNIAVGAAARLDPAGVIVCGFSGWYYPRQETMGRSAKRRIS